MFNVDDKGTVSDFSTSVLSLRKLPPLSSHNWQDHTKAILRRLLIQRSADGRILGRLGVSRCTITEKSEGKKRGSDNVIMIPDRRFPRRTNPQ